jgi:1,4-alpha-glucan branching enzyme
MKTTTSSPPRRSPAASHLITEQDIYLLKEGTHGHLYDKLGSTLGADEGVEGCRFALWAPNAEAVSVIGDFNGWDPAIHSMRAREDGSGVWEAFVPGASEGACYKYSIVSRPHRQRTDKGDPFAKYWQIPPATASRVWPLDYTWADGDWMATRERANALDAPWSIYEVHLGSWMRSPEEGNRSLSYRELAPRLASYVRELGFSHVEFMPVMEHPFYGSWGYQCTGFFAPSARYGTPQDFMYLVDHLHQNGIGVVLDWVPSHFPGDVHGLAEFDGTSLYEHQDPRQGFHPEWSSYIFNYGRNEVRAFLTSSALFWLNRYHADALRVDAVASMLYLDYARKDGEWIANEYGGRENLAAVAFLREMNQSAYRDQPATQTIAEESTAWPMVSRPTSLGGLGFGMKWNMGWMHDTLEYFAQDPVHRRYHQNALTFSIWYAFSENFVLALSHDEVVYGKGSLLRRMPGDDWQRFANLRLLFGYMWAHPGKKLVFMGGEFGQWNEWNHEASLDWHLLEQPSHFGMKRWVQDLNTFYRKEPALWQLDFAAEGFEWVDFHDAERSIVSFIRKSTEGTMVLVVLNLTPVPRASYRVGVPRAGYWEECLNSDAPLYGGSGQGNLGGSQSDPVGVQGRYHSLTLTLPPLAVLYLKHQEGVR